MLNIHIAVTFKCMLGGRQRLAFNLPPLFASTDQLTGKFTNIFLFYVS